MTKKNPKKQTNIKITRKKENTSSHRMILKDHPSHRLFTWPKDAEVFAYVPPD